MINKDTINSIFNNDEFSDLLIDLSFRWEDEQGYEDIRDYAIPLRKCIDKIAPNSGITKDMCMSTSPFGIKAIVDYTYANGVTRPSILSIVVNDDGSYEWKVTLPNVNIC